MFNPELGPLYGGRADILNVTNINRNLIANLRAAMVMSGTCMIQPGKKQHTACVQSNPKRACCVLSKLRAAEKVCVFTYGSTGPKGKDHKMPNNQEIVPAEDQNACGIMVDAVNALLNVVINLELGCRTIRDSYKPGVVVDLGRNRYITTDAIHRTDTTYLAYVTNPPVNIRQAAKTFEHRFYMTHPAQAACNLNQAANGISPFWEAVGWGALTAITGAAAGVAVEAALVTGGVLVAISPAGAVIGLCVGGIWFGLQYWHLGSAKHQTEMQAKMAEIKKLLEQGGNPDSYEIDQIIREVIRPYEKDMNKETKGLWEGTQLEITQARNGRLPRLAAAPEAEERQALTSAQHKRVG